MTFLCSRNDHRRIERENPGGLSGPVLKAFTKVCSLYPLCECIIIILNLTDEEMDSLEGAAYVQGHIASKWHS